MATAPASKPRKRDITRQKVIQAAIDCIYKEGFNAAHTNRIAESAGVSWGVLQYHFGDKDGLLQAVLDTIFDDFFNALSAAELDGETLRDRVGQLSEIIWELVSGRNYRVTMAILRNAGKDKRSKIEGQKQVTQWSSKIEGLWTTLLTDATRESAASESARHILFASLRGLADDIGPGGRLGRKGLADERQALADAVTFLLDREQNTPRSR